MKKKLEIIEDEIIELVFMQETICKAVYDDSNIMFLYPLAKIICDRLENVIKKLEAIIYKKS